jgi:cob(I)alamin adenosyltransferase
LGYRLSKIYTRTGDDGTTGLADGDRVRKTHVRVEAFGAVDEMNSAIGLVLAEPTAEEPLRGCLARVQHDLFEVGAELSLPGYSALRAEHTARLESELDALNASLPPLEEFILPGGNRAAAACHVARATSRRAERRVWALAETDTVSPDVLRYLNRLSDLLFVAARVLARADGGAEVLWRNPGRSDGPAEDRHERDQRDPDE